MAKTVVIDPVTRIEGHAKISIFLDDLGEVSDAHFHVVVAGVLKRVALFMKTTLRLTQITPLPVERMA